MVTICSSRCTCDAFANRPGWAAGWGRLRACDFYLTNWLYTEENRENTTSPRTLRWPAKLGT